MKGCTFPGSTISCDGAVCCGVTTETEGTAICAVSARTVFPCQWRGRMAYNTKPPKTKRNAPAMSQPRFDRRRPFTTLRDGGPGLETLICVCDCIGITLCFLRFFPIV